MNMGKDWRIETDGLDYFRHQKKTLEVADRRPVIRKGSDLVGPGIGASAVRLDDYNDLLATFDGYFSSSPGAANAPNDTEAFVGHVISDSEFGGLQVFTGLTSRSEFRRTFARSPVDPEAIAWSLWTDDNRVPPTATTISERDTTVPPNAVYLIASPDIEVTGGGFVYERTTAGINIRRPGVYTGSVQVGDRVGGVTATRLSLFYPKGSETAQSIHLTVPLAQTFHIPFTAVAADAEQSFAVAIQHASGGNRDIWWRFMCTRVGDAS